MDDEIGFSLSDLRRGLKKLGRGANLALNPLAQMRALRRAAGGGRRGGGVRAADPTESRSVALQQPGGTLGRRFRGARMAPVGFPAFTFTSTSGALLQASIQPQSVINVRKLVIDVTRIGASAATQRVTLAQVLCGSDNQLPVVPGANAGVDVSLFARDVNDNDVSWAPVGLGQLLTMQLAITGTALAVGDSIVVAVSMNAITAS